MGILSNVILLIVLITLGCTTASNGPGSPAGKGGETAQKVDPQEVKVTGALEVKVVDPSQAKKDVTSLCQQRPSTETRDNPLPVKKDNAISLDRVSFIELVNNRTPSGKPFTARITLPKGIPAEKVEVGIYFMAKKNGEKVPPPDPVLLKKGEETINNQVVYTIQAKVPKHKEIFKGIERKWYEVWWRARRATVEINVYPHQGSKETKEQEFAIPKQMWAAIWGAVVVLSLVFVASIWPNPFSKDTRFKDDTRTKDWGNRRKFVRFLLLPLKFTITQNTGRYSVSLFQILFWTSIVIFASVYVFVVRGEFINITDQVLVLLGISGGTALASKVTAVLRSEEIPPKYFEGISRNRLPKLGDLVCIEGTPNIFKFQMFAFTLINGAIVLKRLVTQFDFPDIPASQMILMGINSGVYIGNEIGMENIWETIKKKVDYAGSDENKINEVKSEVQRLLESIFYKPKQQAQ